MKRIVIIISCLALIGLTVAIMGLVSGNNRAKGAYKFYYYPKLNAYYDVEYNYYLYTIDGGKTWREKPALQREEAEKLGEHIVLRNNEKEIWRDNQLHRQQYQGVVYNFYDAGHIEKRSVRSRSSTINSEKVTRKQQYLQPAREEVVFEAKQAKVEELPKEEWDQPEQIEVKVMDETIEEYIGKTTEELRKRIERQKQREVEAEANRD